MQAKHQMTKLMKLDCIAVYNKNSEMFQDKQMYQEKVLHGGICRIYLSISNKWKPCHGVINSRPCNLRMALKKYFQFQ